MVRYTSVIMGPSPHLPRAVGFCRVFSIFLGKKIGVDGEIVERYILLVIFQYRTADS